MCRLKTRRTFRGDLIQMYTFFNHIDDVMLHISSNHQLLKKKILILKSLFCNTNTRNYIVIPAVTELHHSGTPY